MQMKLHSFHENIFSTRDHGFSQRSVDGFILFEQEQGGQDSLTRIVSG